MRDIAHFILDHSLSLPKVEACLSMLTSEWRTGGALAATIRS